jgi:chromosome segregation ATPase
MTKPTKAKKPETEIVQAGGAVISNRTPEVIAAEIRSIDQQARQYVLQSAIEIGRRLTEAKELVAHGEWGNWLKANVNYSQSSANNFMKISVEYANSQTLANLNYSQAIALLSVPAEEREAFVEENNVSDMSTRELQAAIKEKQELERQLEEERERIKTEQLAREEEQTQRELLRTKYQELLEERQKLETDLAAAQEAANKPVKSAASGSDAAKAKTELRKAEKALSESQKRITDLEAEMKAKEDELNAKVEAAMKEREKELAEQARKQQEESAKQIADLQEQLRKNNNTAAIKVKVHFETLLSTFNELTVAVLSLENEEQKKAISGRIATLCDEMKVKLQG